MNILKMIDHTILKATATSKDIEKLCLEAKEYGFASVCVNPCRVKLASTLLKEPNKDGYKPAVCTVVGFPLGATTSTQKVEETKTAIQDGATEIDMVINIGEAKEGNWDFVQHDIEAVVNSAKSIDSSILVKVIFENCYLTKEEIVKACECAVNAKADFVKTSTGFGTPGLDKEGNPIAIGATPEDVAIMRKTVTPNIAVKAAGGIRDLASAMDMVNAGATRLGCSAGLIIAKELLGEKEESLTSNY